METVCAIFWFLFVSNVMVSTNSAIIPSNVSTATPTPLDLALLPPKQLPKVQPVPNPYRFTFGRNIVPINLKSNSSLFKINASKQSSKINQSITQTLTQSSNKDKNWLLTKAWLIDNINRLRHELSELERDYSQHLQSSDQAANQKEKQFIEEIARLRADHTVLSLQQKQIIYLIKKNPLIKQKSSSILSENDINYKPHFSKMAKLNSKTKKIADSPTRRPAKRDLSSSRSFAYENESFETETRRNTKEMFTELSSLHDITLALFDDLRKIERKIDTRDKLTFH